MTLKARTGIDARTAGVYFKQQLFEIWDIVQLAKTDLAKPDYNRTMRLPLGFKIIQDRISSLIANGITEAELVDAFYDVFGGSGTAVEARAEYQSLKADIAALSTAVSNNIGLFVPSLDVNKQVVFVTPLSAGQTSALTTAMDAVTARFS